MLRDQIGEIKIGRPNTTRLSVAYFNAGVREFWLVDSRGDALFFRIHRRGQTGFEPVPPEADGFQLSEVLACRYRLERTWHEELERWEFDLIEKTEST